METKPDEAKKPEKKMVPESDLVAFKRGAIEREKRLKEELAKKDDALAEANAQLKIAQANLEDDAEVAKVRDSLVERDRKLTEKEQKLEKDLASFNEREQEVRVQALATEHGVEIDDIKDAEDPEKEALRLKAERLTKEAEEAKKSPESLYESGTPGSVKTQPKDMSDEEFEAHVKAERTKALSK